jgi:hypothetical protein
MFIIIVIVSFATSFFSSYVVLKDRDKFGMAFSDWQRVRGIQDKDLSKTEYNEEGTEVTVTLKDGRKFIFRWTEDGWVVEEVKEEDPASEDPASEDSSNSSDSSNSGSSSSGGTQAGSRSYAC